MRVQSLGREDTLEQSTAIHSSILVWRIPMDREAWWATFRGVSKKDTTEATQGQQQQLYDRQLFQGRGSAE